jgi:flagellar hook-associated protein 2
MAGMRINTGSGIDPKMIDQLIEIERQPIKLIEQKKATVASEKKVFGELKGLVSELGTTLNSMRTKTDFFKLKLESTNPEIVEGTVDNTAPIGSYEVEVKQIAKSNKLLTQTFPDKDKSSVGFGYMSIELDDGKSFDVEIDPDNSTLQDVATQINAENIGAHAIVVNTKESLENDEEDNYRLLVISDKSGKAAKIYMDPDTTFLDLKEQVHGQNLHMLFEDVPIYNETNKVTELIPGMVLDVKKASPGTKVTLKIGFDNEKTMENIKKFVDSYNKVNQFVENQFKFDAEKNTAGPLSKDNSIRALRRTLQSSIQFSVSGGKFQTLNDVGISTDPKNGSLKLDETKLKKALADDYVGVSKLFIQSEKSSGVGVRMSDSVRQLQSMQSGILPSKDREYKRAIDAFDKNIVEKERFAAQRADSIKRKFSAVEKLLSNLNSQGQALQRMGAGSGGEGG